MAKKQATINGMRTLISVGRDITKRRRSEEALELLCKQLSGRPPLADFIKIMGRILRG